MAFPVVRCRPGYTGGWYRDVAIDPTSSRLTLLERLPQPPKRDESAFHDELVEIGRTVRHLGPEGSDGTRSSFGFFLLDRAYRVKYRKKRHELLRGEFGSVSSETSYWYDQRYRGQATSFEVGAHSLGIGTQGPIVSEVSSSPGVDRVVAMSFVRVVRASPEYAVFSATYSPDGVLQWLDVSAARNGDRAEAAALVGTDPPINGGGSLGARGLRDWYGVPSRFPLAPYLASGEPFWPSSAFPEVVTAVQLHLDRDRWVRQDLFRDGKRASQLLYFPDSRQDKMLAVIDLNRGFGSWTSATWD
jgi:hypothetical protein